MDYAFKELTIIIVLFEEKKDLLFSCLNNIKNFKIIIIDNAGNSKLKIEVESNFSIYKYILNKKNFGFTKAMIECFPTYISSILKFLFYTLINSNFKKRIYLNRVSGFYNAFIGKSSWYRPKIDN